MTDVLSIVLFASAIVGGGIILLVVLGSRSKTRAAAETARQLSNLRIMLPREEVIEGVGSRIPQGPEPKVSLLSDGDLEFLEAVLKSKEMRVRLKRTIKDSLDGK